MNDNEVTLSNDRAWHSAITLADGEHIWLRGYEVTDLMTHATFAEVVLLLHQGELPSPGVQKLMNALLIASAECRVDARSALAARAAASGNRRGLEAAIAAGVLAIGDAHGGAGAPCLEMIAHAVARVQRESIPLEQAAAQIITEAKTAGQRLPGLGLRAQTTDPRVATLFRLAAEARVAGDGIAFMRALERQAREHIAYLPINLDGAIAAILYDLGFAPAFAKALYIIAHVAGLSAHVLEEYAREQPLRIKIPVEYDGPKPRAVPRS
ncbi:MAG: citryl-CoA lyase [Chloroflexi bacterium]|nr:citryl-CoA lyase [Chloroflexota bacterium]